MIDILDLEKDTALLKDLGVELSNLESHILILKMTIIYRQI